MTDVTITTRVDSLCSSSSAGESNSVSNLLDISIHISLSRTPVLRFPSGMQANSCVFNLNYKRYITLNCREFLSWNSIMWFLIDDLLVPCSGCCVFMRSAPVLFHGMQGFKFFIAYIAVECLAPIAAEQIKPGYTSQW